MKITDEMKDENYWADAFEYACDFIQEKYSYSEEEWEDMDNISFAKLYEKEFNCKVELVRSEDFGVPLINGTDIKFLPLHEDAYILGEVTFNTQEDFDNYVKQFCGKPYIYPYMKFLDEHKHDNTED